jgi:hypothetical protein
LKKHNAELEIDIDWDRFSGIGGAKIVAHFKNEGGYESTDNGLHIRSGYLMEITADNIR